MLLPSATPRLSIILPTLNGRSELELLLPALEAQSLAGEFEVCAIDSSSTDGTRELLERFGIVPVQIARSEFRHGATRNAAAARARGEFLVFLSQDVLPTAGDFLERLIAPFEDARVAGAYCRVLPHPNNDLLTARTVLDLPEAGTAPQVRDLDGLEGLWSLAPEDRARMLRFNNVASAARAKVFRAIPLPDVSFGEDFSWAARVLTAGHRIAFTPAASVHHAHRYRPGSAFERYRVDALFHRLTHGWRLRPSLWSTARGFLYEIRADFAFAKRLGLRRHFGELLRAPALRAAQVLGQYVGSKGWSGGRRARRLSSVHARPSI